MTLEELLAELEIAMQLERDWYNSIPDCLERRIDTERAALVAQLNKLNALLEPYGYKLYYIRKGAGLEITICKKQLL